MERRNYFAANTVPSFDAALVDESLGFVKRSDLDGMNMLQTRVVS